MREYIKYEKEILKCIEANNLFTIEMVFSFYSGISRSQFYNLKLNKSDILKKALDDNKNRTKQNLLARWFKSDNPTLQIALYKLIGTQDEYMALANAKQEVEHSGGGEITIVRKIIGNDKKKAND